MITINLFHPHVIATIVFALLIIVGIKFGDSEKKTAWMFFFVPAGFGFYIVYWVIVLFDYLNSRI